MQSEGSIAVFHFLFCELIEECYSLYKQDHYIDNLKRIGKDCGFKMFNKICLKKAIFERPQTLNILAKNIQQKVFKYLFGYQASSFYTATQGEQNQSKQYFYVIGDSISIYLTWMPQHLWDTATFFAGFIESIMICSGVKCEVTCATKSENGDKIQTQFFIKISEKQYQNWKQQ